MTGWGNMLSLRLLLVLAGFLGSSVVMASEPDTQVEEILSEPLDAESYGDSPRCIDVRRIRSSRVLNNQHLAFQVGIDKYYLVQFRNRCPMLERNATISYETRGGQLCVLDSIRGVIGFGGSARLGPPCQIPGFQEITREQLVGLREQLKQDVRRPDLIDEPEHSDNPVPDAESDPGQSG